MFSAPLCDDSYENLREAHSERDYRPRAVLDALRGTTDEVIKRLGWMQTAAGWEYEGR